jgi:hypothetical protein
VSVVYEQEVGVAYEQEVGVVYMNIEEVGWCTPL